MLIFGIIGFISTSALAIIGLLQQNFNLVKYLPYGVILFLLNIIYLKIIRLSREDYENKLKQEKAYSQQLLNSQKNFLRHAIHETNTPLAVIMANIEIYELELGKNPLLSNIEAATKNIYTIYDDFSYLIKNDKIDYPKINIVLFDFIQSRIDFFYVLARQSKLSFQIQQKCNTASILINETKLLRIIDNNITNAIKFTKKLETIDIIIDEDDMHYIFEIMSPSLIIQDVNKVFDSYYREDIHQEGLGLGLNLVQKICKEEDIKIEVISETDMTSFKYYFKKVKYENTTT